MTPRVNGPGNYTFGISLWMLGCWLAVGGSLRAQTPFVRESSYVVAGGYAQIQTPALHLTQKGFQMQGGRRVRAWMTTGFDFSRTAGLAQIDAAQLQPALRTRVDGAVAQYKAAGLLPAGYLFSLPSQTESTSFSFGPQMTLRLPHGVGLLGSPAAGALRERTTARPSDPFQTTVVQQAMPSGTKLDWTPFLGGTGGIEKSFTARVAVKAQLDVLYSHPFDDVLARGNWSYRYTFGVVLRGSPAQAAVR